MSQAGAGSCGVCGREKPLVKGASAGQPDLCERCYRTSHPRVRECGVCGRDRPIHVRARDGRPDVCKSCDRRPERRCGRCGKLRRIALAATATDPALGVCCYRPPLASCSDCGRERPCVAASGPEPRCLSCTKKRRAKPCLDCGKQRPGHRRVEGGVLCAACYRLRGGNRGTCRVCETEAGLVRGRCARCQLGARIEAIEERSDPAAVAALGPYLLALKAARRPDSTLRWLQSPAFKLLEALLAGNIEVTHVGLDDAQDGAFPWRTVAFLRAGLVHHGVLEARDEQSASFARWQQRATERIGPGTDRAHVRAYATWEVAHQLARSVRRERTPPAAAQKYARAHVGEAIKLVGWLHHQQLELTDLRQDILDDWISGAATARRRVRLFVAWLARGQIIAPLQVEWHKHGAGARPLGEDRRFEVVRALLHAGDADPRDRLAGCLLLLYAQPLTRTAALKTSEVSINSDGETTITFARGQVALPDPLGAVALQLRDQRSQASGGDDWLLAGRKAGTHITAERLRARLKPYGIVSCPGRHAALLALGARLPAPILAERLGFHQARAAKWVRAAGATYGDYVALRNRQDERLIEPPPRR